MQIEMQNEIAQVEKDAVLHKKIQMHQDLTE